MIDIAGMRGANSFVPCMVTSHNNNYQLIYKKANKQMHKKNAILNFRVGTVTNEKKDWNKFMILHTVNQSEVLCHYCAFQL